VTAASAQVVERVHFDPQPVAVNDLDPIGMMDLGSKGADDAELESAGFDGLCEDCEPRWSFSGGALIMHRSTPDSIVLMQDTTDPTRNLNADDFDFDWRAGWQVTIGRELTCGGRIETRLLSIDSWNANAAATTNSSLANPLQINTNPPTFAPNVQTIGASYGSDLLSLEVNYAHELSSCFDWLAGFRYLELDELLHADLNAAPQFFTYDINTRNRLYGFQTGLAGSLWNGERWTLSSQLKAGIFHNSAAHASQLNTGVTQPALGSANRAALVGEISVLAEYAITDSLSARFGYDLLWLETVALASDQIPATNLFTQQGIAADGGVFYHGALVGLQWTR